MKVSFLLALCLLLPMMCFAVSEVACIFLLIEPGSRAGGMGNAHVAQADDGFAGYWNPGAMAFNKQSKMSWWHTNWLGDVDGIDDMYINYIGGHSFIESIGGNVGAHLIYFTYGEQDQTDANGNLLRSFESYEMAIALTYARQMTDNLGLGLTLKYIYSNLSPVGTGNTETNAKGSGKAFAFDFGLKYQDLFTLKGLDIGLNLQNVGSDITFINESQSDPLPMNLRTGVSYRLIENKSGKITINGDMNKLLANQDPVLQRLFTAWYDDKSKQEWDSTIFSWGVEMVSFNLLYHDKYKTMFSIRSGYLSDKAGSIEGYSGGVGLSFSISGYSISLDYDMRPGGELTTYNKTLSVGIGF